MTAATLRTISTASSALNNLLMPRGGASSSKSVLSL
jgi:hypothetical protein